MLLPPCYPRLQCWGCVFATFLQRESQHWRRGFRRGGIIKKESKDRSCLTEAWLRCAFSNRQARPLDVRRWQRNTYQCRPLRFDFVSTVPVGGCFVWFNAPGQLAQLQRNPSETTVGKGEEVWKEEADHGLQGIATKQRVFNGRSKLKS